MKHPQKYTIDETAFILMKANLALTQHQSVNSDFPNLARANAAAAAILITTYAKKGRTK